MQMASLVLAAVLGAHSNCPFCSEERGPTLVGDFGQASLVLYGSFTNPRISGEETATDFIIEKVLKPHPILKDKSKITLTRFIKQPNSKFLIFCDIYKDAIDPYRGVEVKGDSDMVKYLLGAMEMKDKSAADRLRYCFEYLNNPEYEVAIDAYREYAKADYKDYMSMAKTLNPDIISGWLKDPNTPSFRYGLYASLLGHCGKEEHGKFLRSLIDDPEKRKGSSVEGLFAGYHMIQPKEAYAHLCNLLKDAKQEFVLRYSCLRTIRFLWEQRPDLVPQKELIDGLGLILAQADMADFAIEDLRKYKRWEMTDQVLDLREKKDFEIPVVKRAILRFALQSPAPRAKTYVEAERRRDAELVRDAEELLKLETDPVK